MSTVTYTHVLSPQQPVCHNCGTGGTAGYTRKGTGSITFFCAGCGDVLKHAYRDGVPLSVWGTLVDNEDEHGRVPADPAWQPPTSGSED